MTMGCENLQDIFWVDRLKNYYSTLYRGAIKHDSPDLTRIHTIRRIVGIIRDCGCNPPNILDIGSGPQSLVKEFYIAYGKRKEYMDHSFFTMDVADIPREKLLMNKYGPSNHTRGGALNLPYLNGSFGIVVSNMAIDFLPDEAYREVYRVLNPGGYAIFSFHHPYLLTSDLDKNDEIKAEFYNYLREANKLFSCKGDIQVKLKSFGLSALEITEQADRHLSDKWWEVLARKN